MNRSCQLCHNISFANSLGRYILALFSHNLLLFPQRLVYDLKQDVYRCVCRVVTCGSKVKWCVKRGRASQKWPVDWVFTGGLASPLGI